MQGQFYPHETARADAGMFETESASPVRTGDWIETVTGIEFWPLNPRQEDVSVFDIAHALSNMCRFTGHCKTFYSVAQHSLLVASIVPDEDRKWALLHDAAEAYLVDLPRPIKRYSALGDEYRRIESRLMQVICQRFGLPEECPASVKHADDVLLATEKRDLMPANTKPWEHLPSPLNSIIRPMSPTVARRKFLKELAVEEVL